MNPTLYGLDKYGLTESALHTTELLLQVSVHLRFPNPSDFYAYSPKERKLLIAQWYQKRYANIIKNVVINDLHILGKKHDPRGFEGWISSTDLLSLLQQQEIESIFVNHVKDVAPIAQKESDNTIRWYAITARYAIQIENQVKGFQTHEIRTLLVKAVSEDEAKEKVQKEAESYGTPYLNVNLELVRWQLVEILDTHEICDDIERDEVIEIASKWQTKRITPELTWQPHY